jgi:uncharacterized protein (TIGR03382 family)
VSCDDADATIATLTLGRDSGAPDADGVRFQVTPWGSDPSLPVLVCIDSELTASAWITLDDRAIATPSDFHPSVHHLERQDVLERGTSKLAGVIASKPGASLVVRVLADPGRGGAASGGTTDPGGSTSTTSGPGPRDPHAAGAGCGSPGMSPLALLALVAALWRRRR